MMKKTMDRLSAQEGWSESTNVAVLCGIIDQYGETHQVESNGEVWVVLVE